MGESMALKQELEEECLSEREQDHLHAPCILPPVKHIKGGGIWVEWANIELNGD